MKEDVKELVHDLEQYLRDCTGFKDNPNYNQFYLDGKSFAYGTVIRRLKLILKWSENGTNDQ